MSEDSDRGIAGEDDAGPTEGGTGASGRAAGVPDNVQRGIEKSRERLQAEADRTVDAFDEGIVDLLAWVLDTETRARIYVYLRQHPEATSDEIAEGTGLYPSTVREALAELTDEDKVTRQKRESEGAGNNPYEYEAIPPSDLVGTILEDVQRELNTVFNLDRYLDREAGVDAETEPISITVEGEDEAAEGGEEAAVEPAAGEGDVEGMAEESGEEGDETTDESTAGAADESAGDTDEADEETEE